MKIYIESKPLKKAFTTVLLLILLVPVSRLQAQISGTTPASRCFAGAVVLHATAASGTIQWYDVPFYGTPIPRGASANGTVSSDGNSFTTPSLSVTKTFFVDALDGSGCSLNTGSKRVAVLATVTSGSVQSNIYYSSSTFCQNTAGSQAITRNGTDGGAFTYYVKSSPGTVYSPGSGPLTISTDGAITPGSSTSGTYVVTYTVVPVAGSGCTENPATTEVSIATATLEPNFHYDGSPFCTSIAGTITIQGGTNLTGGSFSSAPAGLSMDASGTITPSTSTPGNYTVTYAIPGTGGCSPQTHSEHVTITGLPVVSISYDGNPFCVSLSGGQPVALSGTGAFTGGNFRNAGTGTLSLDSSTGSITPSGSATGTCTVKYTTLATAGCPAVEATAPVTIVPLPSASISGTVMVCADASAQDITFTGSNGTPPYTFTYQVNDGDFLTISTTSESSQAKVSQAAVPGVYTYRLVSVSHVNSCSQTASGTATITVNAAPITTFTYNGSMSCATGTISPIYLNGGMAGTFTSSPPGVVFTTPEGTIDQGASTPGTYTITNTIRGCGADVTASAQVTITHVPTAIISGGESATCASSILTARTDATNKTYVWYKNDVVIDGATDSTYSATSAGSYKVKVTNTDTGCDNISDSKSVTIYAAPECSITTTESGSIIYGSTYTCTAPTGMSSYAWTVSGAGEIVGAANEQTVSVKTTAANPFTLALTISNGNGCTSTCDKTIYVGPAPLTAASTVGTRVYNGTKAAGTVTLGEVSGLKNGETLVITPTAGDYADANVGATKSVTITYSLTNGSGGIASNYTMADMTTTGAITAAPLTAASTIAPKVYDGTNATGVVTLGGVSGLQNGETLVITPTAGNYADAYAGTGKTATITYSIANGVSGLASNYSMADLTTTGAITARQLTTSDPALALTKVYNGTMAAAVTAGTLSEVLVADAANVTVSSTASYDNANVGAGKTITVVYTISGSASGNYIKPVSYTVTNGEITRKALTITAKNQTVQVGTSVATVISAGTYTAVGFAGGDGVGVITGAVTYTTTYTESTAVGSAGITISPQLGGLIADNYSFTPVNGTITIVPLPQGSLSANSICVSGNGRLTWSATAGTGRYTIVYNDGTSNHTAYNVQSGTAFTTEPATVSSTTTYTLVSVTDANLAVRTTSFNGGFAVINVTPPISGNSSGYDIAICNGTSTTLAPASLTGGDNSYSYSWFSGTSQNGSFSLAIGTNDEPNYFTEILTTESQFVWFRRQVRSGACTSLAAPVKVTVVPCTTIDVSAIGGITAPVTGATPVSAATETAQYTATVSWSPAVATFNPGTVYTATITLTPKAGFTLTGITSNFFTVDGTTSVTNGANTGVIDAVFPSTASN